MPLRGAMHGALVNASRGPLGVGIVVAEGDSLTAGFGGATAWPTILGSLNPLPTIFNVAVSAEEVGANMIGQGASQVDSHFSGGAPFNHCVLWGGTNDMGNSGISAATTYGYVQTWCQARRTAHPTWKIVVLNCIKRAGLSDATFRGPFNAQLLAGYATFADAHIDVATLVEDWTTQPSWWQGDQVHLTTAGMTVVANAVSNTLRAL